ncbi:MAG: hypothetical protein ACLQM8_13125 [Limisphaerales bacterium]
MEKFLASKPAWMQRALQGDFSFSSRDEELEWINNQDRVIEQRPEYERILRQISVKWNKYCATLEKNWAETTRFQKGLVVPKGLPGARRKDALAKEAVLLQQRGMNFAQIAAELNKKHGKDATTPGAISKLVKRYLSRTKSSE